MANYAWLVGCPSREVAARYDLTRLFVPTEPELEAKYTIPLLWLACFELSDALTVRSGDSGSEDAPFMVLCAPIGEVLPRLRRRQASVLGLIGPSFAPLYTDWIAFLEGHYAHQLLLRTEDLFSMEGYEKAGLRLKAALRFMGVADSGAMIKERAAIDWFTGLDRAFEQRPVDESPPDTALRWRALLSGNADVGQESSTWPVPVSAEEIAFAARRPQSALPPEPATTEAEEQALTEQVRQGVFADSMSDGLKMAANKLTGHLPLGINAPTKGMRKLIGGSGALLALLMNAMFGILLGLVGLVCLWAGLQDKPDVKTAGLGAALIAISIWPLRSARAALRNLRAIARA